MIIFFASSDTTFNSESKWALTILHTWHFTLGYFFTASVFPWSTKATTYLSCLFLSAPAMPWKDPANIWAESWILPFLRRTSCLPWERHYYYVLSGVRSACCQIGVWIDSCRSTLRTNPLLTACINLVLWCGSVVCQLSPPSQLVSSNDFHTDIPVVVTVSHPNLNRA